jgi:hypothetical protein
MRLYKIFRLSPQSTYSPLRTGPQNRDPSVRTLRLHRDYILFKPLHFIRALCFPPGWKALLGPGEGTRESKYFQDPSFFFYTLHFRAYNPPRV